MALAHARNIEIFAFILPLVLAKPFAEQLGTLLTGTAPVREGQPRFHVVTLAALAIHGCGMGHHESVRGKPSVFIP